jgi:hypothetical protein
LIFRSHKCRSVHSEGFSSTGLASSVASRFPIHTTDCHQGRARPARPADYELTLSTSLVSGGFCFHLLWKPLGRQMKPDNAAEQRRCYQHCYQTIPNGSPRNGAHLVPGCCQQHTRAWHPRCAAIAVVFGEAVEGPIGVSFAHPPRAATVGTLNVGSHHRRPRARNRCVTTWSNPVARHWRASWVIGCAPGTWQQHIRNPARR